MTAREPALPIEGPAAPPRSNGELVFSAPWESRVFGLTVALLKAGRFEWPEFQERLIRAVADHEASRGDAAYDYWGCWLEAFRSLATERGWLEAGAIEALERDFAARPAGHDQRPSDSS